MDIQGPTTVKYQTTCCAMCILSAQEKTEDWELDQQLNRMRAESKMRWEPNNRMSGETLCTIVTTPLFELELEKKLQARGFQVIKEFSRRRGYPKTGKLKLWALDLNVD